MTHKVFLAAAASVAFFVSAGVSSAFPVMPNLAMQKSAVRSVTFWGQAFPYGYNWSLARACTRYETVETSRGPVTRRVWVCGGRYKGAVSYRN